MSLSDTDVKAKYNANGATTTFAIPFPEIDDYDTEVEVITADETDITAVVETVKTLTTHYTISGTNVVFGTAPASGLKVLVRKVASLVQSNFDGTDNGPYPAAQAELAYDRLTAMIQILDEKIKRALKWRRTIATASEDPSLPDPSADACIVWNSGLTGFDNGPTTTTIVAAAANAAAAAASASAASTSASAASTSASNAATSETNAAASAVAAAASAAAVIISGSAMTIADNQAAAANVQDGSANLLRFLTTTNFAVWWFYYRRAAGTIGGHIKCSAYKDGAGAWALVQESEVGAASGLTFSITTSGSYQQVQYTSDNTGAGVGYWVGHNL
jgi:hypothetical protein